MQMQQKFIKNVFIKKMITNMSIRPKNICLLIIINCQHESNNGLQGGTEIVINEESCHLSLTLNSCH